MNATLSPDTSRKVQTIEVTIETNFGETHTYTFETVESAIDFLENLDADHIINDDSGPSLWPSG